MKKRVMRSAYFESRYPTWQCPNCQHLNMFTDTFFEVCSNCKSDHTLNWRDNIVHPEPQKRATDQQKRLEALMRKFNTGIAVRSVHDETDHKWVVETIGLWSRCHINSRKQFYGVTLEEALSKAEASDLVG